MPTRYSTKPFPAQITTEHYIQDCRCHLESLRNITGLLTLEGEHSTQEKFKLRMMAWHLGNLTAAFAHVHG